METEIAQYNFCGNFFYSEICWLYVRHYNMLKMNTSLIGFYSIGVDINNAHHLHMKYLHLISKTQKIHI